ncbi:hypothetical protein GJV26_11220 [Massilia dura]|uniref:Uncharacterized protein n=1 Tax=Pseudoduganella dura TaxID=321982 RepID=A0A6I3XBG7_9BURK|nr:hypothetical protein [Pseudoduganella dura]MUI13026.1 hypothetical protein [Pseudoduganella dura]GGX87793.1 hypothetical protein GCM10007386_18300 [Pseudoduganella dura]
MDKPCNPGINPHIEAGADIKRKYLAEAGLNLFSAGPAQFRPSDIYRFGTHPHFRAALEGTNIYLVCRRRRIAVDPHSIKLKQDGIHGEFLVYGDSCHEWESEKFYPDTGMTGPDGLPMKLVDARPADPFGHAVELLDERGQRVLVPSCALIPHSKHKLGDRTRLEVLYVGQTFGKLGNSLSVDRLSRHTTLQRILAESADQGGQNEILLLGFQYGNSKNILSSAGASWVEPSATSQEEQAHLLKTGRQTFNRKERILLAEAALINYFKPHYNVMHRDSFSRSNSRKLKTLQSLLREDFSALVVEINTANLSAKLWSKTAPRGALSTYFTEQKIEEMRNNVRASGSTNGDDEFDDWIKEQTHAHIAKFALYDRAERETFLHALPWAD